MKVSEQLKDDLLKFGENGERWVKGVPFVPTQHTIISASRHNTTDAYRFLALGARVKRGQLAKWNNAPERTFDDIVAAYRRAAQLAEAVERGMEQVAA